jgi:hypothetical protein
MKPLGKLVVGISPRAGRERLTDFAVVGNSRERRLEKNKKRIITFFNGIRANRKE